ncbi:TniQ family protein [Streptomyces sp. NBC_01579]|uniref:TniQ family protein n=1 Tax=Streptomyces sp. NBC_01579 TaxID=2975885 RepID=UPI003865CE80
MTRVPGTFPIRVRPLPGEALDSWLEALAFRLHTQVGDVLAGLGVGTAEDQTAGTVSTETLTRRLTPTQATAISRTTEVPAATLHTMTLAHYDGQALALGPRTALAASTRWGNSTGYRFCPDCLIESSGRWQLNWRLGWTFACIKHSRLLADRCPQCHRPVRARPAAGQEIPRPGHCPNTLRKGHADARPGRCDADLTRQVTPKLDYGHPALHAQRLVDAMVESGTADFGPYAEHPQRSLVALADLRAVVGQIFVHAPRTQLAERLPVDLPLTAEEVNTLLTYADSEVLKRRGMLAPNSAAITAVGVTLAAEILTQPDIQQAGAALRWTIGTGAGPQDWQGRSPLGPWGKATTETLRSVQLAAAGPRLRAVEQLRHRTIATRPGVQPSSRIRERLRSLPTAFWPELALPLVPPLQHQHRISRPALSCFVGLVGSLHSATAVAGLLGNGTTGFMASRMLAHLHDHQQWPDIQTALLRIAEYLDANPSPIDYERRRSIDYTGLLSDAQWTDIAREIGRQRGSGALARLFRKFLFVRISGLPSALAPSTCAPANISARSQHAMRYRRLTPVLLAHLDHAAEEFLQRHGVSAEPVAWHPPAELLHGLALPGHSPSEIDIATLHRLIRESGMTATDAARHLGTTLDVVRCILDQHPAPDPSAGTSRPSPVSDPVRAALGPAEFADLYLNKRMSLEAIGALHGVKPDVIRGIAEEYEIPIRTPKEYRHRQELTWEWLHEQYVELGRTLDDIADETGMTRSNVAKRLKIAGIPLRPRGGASHREALRVQAQARQAPRLLRPALNSPAAESRLRHLVAASTHPTLNEAARALGLHNSTLVNQLNRLARELGGPLLERAERGRPMKLTPLGKRVVRTATAWLPAP